MSQGNWPLWGLRDPVSAATHFAAFLLAVLGTILLWRLCRGNWRKRLAISCFGLSMMVLYAASTTYHSLQLPAKQLKFYQLLDQSAIYGLIAGTYTPVVILLFRPGLYKYLLLGTIWSFAIAGVFCKWMLPAEPLWLTITLYLCMGWLAVLPVSALARVVGFQGVWWIVCGGVAYSWGAILDLIGWPVLYPRVVGPHEMAHVLDMAGTYCHFVFMIQFVAPFPERRRRSLTTLAPVTGASVRVSFRP
jgi:hemolysin III